MTRSPPERREPTREQVARTRAAALAAWHELHIYAFQTIEVSTLLAVCEAADNWLEQEQRTKQEKQENKK